MGKILGRWMKVALSLFTLAAIIFFLFSFADLVKVLILSALLAYILDPIVVFTESRGMDRTWATSIIFFGILLGIGISLFLVIPILSKQMRAIEDGLQAGRLNVLASNVERFLENKFAFLGVEDLNLMERINHAMASLGGWIFAHIRSLASLLIYTFLVPFIVFFLLKDGREMKKKLIALVPNRYFEFSLDMLYELDLQLGNYFRGQFFDALIVGLLSTFALWVVGVKYFLIIGAVAGVANLIPYLGPIVGAFTAILVSIITTGNVMISLYSGLAFILVKLIDDGFVQPMVVGKTVRMHPLLVLLVVIIGGKYFGILGMVLAVPITGFIRVLTTEIVINFRKYRLIHSKVF